MEIDPELPSGIDKKLDVYVGKSAINDSIQSHAGEENVEENVDTSGNWIGIDIVDVNIIDKGIANSEPQKGMEFETKEAAYSFYREYARSVGFGITIKASRRSKKSGIFIDVKIACSRFGTKRESGSSQSCPKTDCKASIHMKRKQEGKWYIHSFVKEHNHEIYPDDFYYSVRGRSKQSANVVYQKKGLQLALDEGDVELLLDTLALMQAERPNSYYTIDFDKEKRMRNIFWIDAKGRNDYGYFCDVIYLDTYYVRNKYKVPFLPIVGVNHHFQFLLLGCALVGDESSLTFAWLMRTWLRAVGGQSPRVVITDDDISLKEAVEEVFPKAQHCFCLWHVMGKVSQNLGNKISKTEDFVKKLKKCMWLPLKEEEFEKRWWKMVNSFRLRDDDLIRSLFESRIKWVPVYMGNTFLAGLSTVERSKSVSSFFERYISSETTFKGFIDQYKLFVHEMYEEEAKADIETCHRQPTIKTLSPYEKQMSTIYTNSVFMKFQAEVAGIAVCTILNEDEDGTEKLYRVNDREKHESFMVSWCGRESLIVCSCHFFEYTGILCKHAITVLQVSGVSHIPAVYVLERWTREAKIKQTACGIPSNPIYRIQRLNDLCKLAAKFGEVGSLSWETYESAVNALKAALHDCVNANNSVKSALVSNISFSRCNPNVNEEIQGGSMAKSSKRKKVQKKCKVQSNVEVLATRIQDRSLQMDQSNSKLPTHEDAFLAQRHVQGMDPGARMATVDGYSAPHQSVHGLGQLSSFSMLQDNYCSNHQASHSILGNLNYISAHGGRYSPQSIQGLGQLSFRAPLLHTSFDIQGNSSDMDNSTSVTGKHLQD